MARGKKASGKHYTSKGERPNVNKSVLKPKDVIINKTHYN